VEDALFSLMMEEFMEQQGRELLELNEKLKSEPDDELLTVSKKRCEKVIYRYFKRQKVLRRRKYLKTIGRVLAAATLAMVLVTATAFAASESFRVYVLNLMIDMTDSEITFQFGEYSDSTKDQTLPEENFVLGWMPEDFEETNRRIDEAEIFYEFTNKEGARIFVREMDGRYSTLTVSCDDAEVQTIEIGDHAAYLVEYDNICEITWADNDGILLINVCTEGVTPDVTLKIAENLSY
jgi:hypothetical protein